MIRSAAAVRASLAMPLDFNPQFPRLLKASLVRQALRLTDVDWGKANRCRSVREQQQWEAREVDGLPEWL